MITVELDIFSGLENPRWDLAPDEATGFIEALVDDLAVVRPLLSVGDDGAKGFIIHVTGEHRSLLGLLGVPTIFRITDQPFDPSFLEIPLTPSAAGDAESILGSADDPSEGDEAQSFALLAACSLAYTSWNDFSFWNGSRQQSNNCYCYAANYATNNWSHPGRKGGAPIPTTYAYSSRPGITRFTNAMTADGWRTSCNGESLHVVAYVGKITYDSIYAPQWDYHFWRKNLDGSANRWCHKPGTTKARNKDYSGNFITSVGSADRSKYFPATTSFPVGYTINYDERIGAFRTPAGKRSLVIQ